MVEPSVFSQLWEAAQEPFQSLERRVARLERHMSRAEVAGAVERVDALPAPGQPGRMLSTQQNVFVDSGPAFFPVGKMLGWKYQVNAAGWSNTADPLAWLPLFDGAFYIDLTPSGDTAYVRAETTLHLFVSPPNASAGRRTLFLDSVNLGDDEVGLGLIEIGPAYPLTGSTSFVTQYISAARLTGLTPGRTYRLTVQVKSTNASYPVTTAINRSNCLMAWEA